MKTCKECGQSIQAPKNDLDDQERRDLKAASDAIINSFVWHVTKEGLDYWDAVYKRLRRISEGEPL